MGIIIVLAERIGVVGEAIVYLRLDFVFQGARLTFDLRFEALGQ